MKTGEPVESLSLETKYSPVNEKIQHTIWMGFFTVISFAVSPGQMRVMVVVTVESGEVSIHTFGAICEGIQILLSFPDLW